MIIRWINLAWKAESQNYEKLKIQHRVFFDDGQTVCGKMQIWLEYFKKAQPHLLVSRDATTRWTREPKNNRGFVKILMLIA